MLSGKYGVVNGAEAVAMWNINDDSSPVPIIDSATALGTNRVGGVNAWDGGFTQNVAQPGTFPGSTLSFAGFTAPDDGQPTGTGTVYSGTALVNQLVLNWDWAGGQNLTAVTSFLGHLGLTIGDANHADASLSDPFGICGTKIEYSTDGTVWTELPNCASAALTLSCAVSSYVNSSTGCNTGRAAGPRDWTASIVIDDHTRVAPIPDKGDVLEWRFWVDASDYYQLKWGRVRNFTNITVNRVTGEIIKQTMNLDMVASDGTELGAVALPDETFWWGTAL